MRLLYPGSFDPLTLGHMDVIERASRLADELIVAVGINAAKQPLFNAEQRCAMIEQSVAHLPNVRVVTMPGTLIGAVQEHQATAVIKGVRDSNDLASETTQAAVNRDLGQVETLLIPARGDLAHVSSTVVREMLRWGMDTSRYVPLPVHAFINENRT